MSQDRFNDSLFSQLLYSNDLRIIEWARNVYNKIKGDGILPQYVDREKGENISNINVTSATLAPLLHTNPLFTFGTCLSDNNQFLPLESTVDLGVSHTVEFEVSSVDMDTINIISNSNGNYYILISKGYIVYKSLNEILTSSLCNILPISKVKVIRNHKAISYYADEALVSTKTLSNDLPFTFNMIGNNIIFDAVISIYADQTYGTHIVLIMNILHQGQYTITQCGVCWGVNPLPTVAGDHAILGSGIGVFNADITGLFPQRTYYIRPYYINSQGTYYGEQLIEMTDNIGIGEPWEGGLVSYIYGPGDRGYSPYYTTGLIVKTDNLPELSWGPMTQDVGTWIPIGYGADNTNDILNLWGVDAPAAHYCHQISEYPLWFLPSLLELGTVFENLGYIAPYNSISHAWTSTEGDDSQQDAFSCDWDSNEGILTYGQYPKSTTYKVIPMHLFTYQP